MIVCAEPGCACSISFAKRRISTTTTKILIYYSPNNPDKSVNRNPKSLFINDLVPFVLAVVLFPLMAAFGTYKRLP